MGRGAPDDRARYVLYTWQSGADLPFSEERASGIKLGIAASSAVYTYDFNDFSHTWSCSTFSHIHQCSIQIPMVEMMCHSTGKAQHIR
jgi:hypothetical protein